MKWVGNFVEASQKLAGLVETFTGILENPCRNSL